MKSGAPHGCEAVSLGTGMADRGRIRLRYSVHMSLTAKNRRKFGLVPAIACMVLAAGVSAADVNLPDIGSPADATLSKNAENQLGRAIMRQIRASGQLVEDPLITEYVNEIGHRVAAQANADGAHRVFLFRH